MDKDRLLPAKHRGALAHLLREIADTDLLEMQAHYVDMFDRSRSLSLHLFEHVHGESRDRGQAMVSLRERYRQAGFDIVANELPDHIPLFLEFLSLLPANEARAMLGECAHVLTAIAERLRKRESGYAAAFEALVALSGTRADEEKVSELGTAEIDNPNDLAALDRAWEEAEVRFGPGDAQEGGCPRVDDMLRKMDVPAKAPQGIEP